MHTTGVTGTPDRMQAWQRFAGENTNWTWVQDTSEAKNFEIFIDLSFDRHPQHLSDYAGNTHTLFLLSAVECTPELAFAQAGLHWKGEKVFGINAIPTFLERKTMEISSPYIGETEKNLNILHSLGWEKLEWVKSRVGMVTPRVVFMIINEAYYTLQEGTASKDAINTAMKLGTNYPKGPFEWCEQAGLDNVYRTLDALYHDTREERYKICPLLKTEWLRLHTT